MPGWAKELGTIMATHSTCPFCKMALPHHDEGCRVPGDLDRFERIHDLLHGTGDKAFLRQNLMRHLVSFGRRAPLGTPALQVNSATTGA